MPKILFALAVILFSLSATAQTKSNVKFGKISAEDFATKVYSVDSNAHAVVIADIGSTEIVGNSKGSFSLEHKRFKRVHILNKNGYDEGTVEVGLYSSGDAEEELLNVKASTYNLEDGKVVASKLDVKGSVFKEKINKNLIVKKFTLPNVKEGSIIEYEYVLKSDFLHNLQPWTFQGQHPVLWSEYNLSLPQFLGYMFLSQGYQNFHIKENKERAGTFSISETQSAAQTERFTIQSNIMDYKWVMKNVPVLKQENFSTTVKNHIAKIEFQLSELKHPLTPRMVMSTWSSFCTEMNQSEDFGLPLNRDNAWLSDVVDPLVKNVKDDKQKIKNIYTYLRDNYTCKDYNARTIEEPLKNVVRSKSGSVADINLLMVAMIRNAGLQADPVLLSTRSHGYTNHMYPLIHQYNYVVAKTSVNGKDIFLDATHPRLGFAKLTTEAYNGHARIINETGTPVILSSDSLLERTVTSIFINTTEKGELTGNFQQIPGYYNSYSLREKIKEVGKEKYFQEQESKFSFPISIKNPIIDSLENYEEPIGIKYEFDVKDDLQDVLYINPMFSEAYKENPFKSANRFYPVEMPYKIDETFVLTMRVPDGYTVDELPQQIILKLNEDDDGQFEYRISSRDGFISMRSRIVLKRTYFEPSEYEMLREFFNVVVKKHKEQIVLKKQK